MACGALQLYYYQARETTLGLTGIGFMTFDVIGIVVIISLYDAIHIKALYKISISGFVGMLFTFVAVVTQLSIDPANDDSVVNIPLLRPVRRISLWMLIISTWRVLAIFSWKQAISTYLATRNSQSKSVFITNYPSIKWNDPVVSSSQVISGHSGDPCDIDNIEMAEDDLKEKNIPIAIPNTNMSTNLSQESNFGNDELGIPSWNIVSSGSVNSINSAMSSGSNGSNMITANRSSENDENEMDCNVDPGIPPQRSIGGIPIEWYDDTEIP